MPGRVRSQLVADEACQGPQFGIPVIEAFQDECRHFQPPAQSAHPHQIVQHGLQAGTAIPMIEILAEGLQVDIGRPHQRPQHLQAAGAHEPVAHQDGRQAPLLSQRGRGRHQLHEDRGLVVGEGQAAAGGAQGRCHQHLRRGLVPADALLLQRITGDMMVLAEQAGKIASGAAHGKRPAAGKEMIQGLLFHRVGLDARHQTVHQRKGTAPVVAAHAAASPLPRREHAGMGAEPAAPPVLCQLRPQHAFHRSLLCGRGQTAQRGRAASPRAAAPRVRQGADSRPVPA